MIKDDYKVIGVMSGTSLDGIDLAYIHFYKKENKWNFDITKVITYEYTENWKQTLNNAFHFETNDLEKVNVTYTQFLANQIQLFIDKNNILEIDAVCSHGHTILHQPENGHTLQIGNLPILAELLQQTVVCDFRVQDVQLGGQGAPLVPIGDELLFSEYDYCLNLGGFSNISFNKENSRKAFDISPVNIVLNQYAEKLGFAFDESGKIAQTGNLNLGLLSKLNTIPFYNKKYPKSLGREFIATEIFPLLEKSNLSTESILRTFTEHIAIQIGKVITNNSRVLITGGGAYNDFLISRLKEIKPTANWIIPNDDLIQFKEALIFGFLGVRGIYMFTYS